MIKTCLTCKKEMEKTVRYSLRQWATRKYCSKKCMRHDLKWKKNASFNKLSEKNPLWKGDKAGLSAIHIWVTKRYIKKPLCEICGIVPPLDLANISQEYKRDMNDWLWLCRKCHMLSDGRLAKLLKNNN